MKFISANLLHYSVLQYRPKPNIVLYSKMLRSIFLKTRCPVSSTWSTSTGINKRLLTGAGQKIEPAEKTMKEVLEKLIKKVGASKSFSEVGDRKHLMGMIPKSQNDLPPRKIEDSKDSAIIPLGSDLSMREKYITFHGGVRVGRILEDLDLFAVWLCYNHISNPLQKPDDPSPYFVVTALVDRIDFHKHLTLKADQDIRLKGYLSWVGTSSMEVTIFVEQKLDGTDWQQVTRAVFVMVARDPLTQRAAFINPLVCETEQEKAIFQNGKVNKLSRKLIQKESLFVAPPNESEKSLVHNLFISMANPEQMSYDPVNRPKNSVAMESSKLKNLIICHPEHRNRFGKIFGGFIMRQAFELSWGCAIVHSKQRPRVIHIDDIMFRKPVDIGSLLYLNSQVVYTEGNHMQISTKASVVDPVSQTSNLTNIFHFTFEAQDPVLTCIPHTYHEALMYLDGRRHYQLARGIRKFYSQGESITDQPAI